LASTVGTQDNTKKQRIGYTPFDETKTDLKNTQITAIGTINQNTQTIPDGTSSDGDQPDIEHSHC
jgi:hypothetical protein